MKKPNGYWNYEKCKEVALKYEKKIYFKSNNRVHITQYILINGLNSLNI